MKQEQINFLYELRYALKNEDRNLGFKYFDNKSNTTRWISNVQTTKFTSTFFEDQLNDKLKNGTKCVGVNIFTNSDVIVIDYDGDHKVNFENNGKQVLNQLVDLFQVEPFFIEWKFTGNFHAWFKLNKNWNKYQKTALENYLKTINSSIEEYSSKEKIIRLPFSEDYRYNENGELLSTSEINEIISNINPENYISNIEPNEFVFLMKEEQIKKQQAYLNTPIFVKKSINNSNFFRDFQFSEGNRNEEWMKYGFMIFAIHNEDIDLTIDYVLSHSGTSKDLNGSQANEVAKNMVLNTAKSFDKDKLPISIIANSNSLYNEHLSLLNDKQKNQIKDLCSIIDRAFNITSSKYKKIRKDNNEALEFVVTWMLTHMQYQINEVIPNKVITDKVNKNTKHILENSFAFYFEIMLKYFNLYFPNNNANLKKIYLRVRDVFENSSIIIQTLAHSSYEGFNWKKQWNCFINDIVNNLKIIIAKVNKYIINPVKDSFRYILSNNTYSSFSYTSSKEKTKDIYGNILDIVSIKEQEKEEDFILNDDDFDWLEEKFPELKKKTLKFA